MFNIIGLFILSVFIIPAIINDFLVMALKKKKMVTIEHGLIIFIITLFIYLI